MSDTMLIGVLRMPLPDNPDPLTLHQFVDRARQAADRIEADAALIERQAAEIERLKAQRVPQVAPATKAQFYVRVSNISGQPSGVFLPNADGSAPDVELRSESLVPVVSAQRVPLTEAQLIDAYCKTPGLHQFVSAFMAGARFAEAAHGIHPLQRENLGFSKEWCMQMAAQEAQENSDLDAGPLQRLADLSKEIGEKL